MNIFFYNHSDLCYSGPIFYLLFQIIREFSVNEENRHIDVTEDFTDMA